MKRNLVLGPGEKLTLARCPAFARLLTLAHATNDAMLAPMLAELTLAAQSKRAPSLRAAMILHETPYSLFVGSGTPTHMPPEQIADTTF